MDVQKLTSRRVRSQVWTSVAMLGACEMPAFAQQKWDTLPRMNLERQFAGPLRDTIIQRWSDPVDGTICYVYLPITAPHSQPTTTGYVQYGASTIGTISCMAGPPTRGGTAKPRP